MVDPKDPGKETEGPSGASPSSVTQESSATSETNKMPREEESKPFSSSGMNPGPDATWDSAEPVDLSKSSSYLSSKTESSHFSTETPTQESLDKVFPESPAKKRFLPFQAWNKENRLYLFFLGSLALVLSLCLSVMGISWNHFETIASQQKTQLRELSQRVQDLEAPLNWADPSTLTSEKLASPDATLATNFSSSFEIYQQEANNKFASLVLQLDTLAQRQESLKEEFTQRIDNIQKSFDQLKTDSVKATSSLAGENSEKSLEEREQMAAHQDKLVSQFQDQFKDLTERYDHISALTQDQTRSLEQIKQEIGQNTQEVSQIHTKMKEEVQKISAPLESRLTQFEKNLQESQSDSQSIAGQMQRMERLLLIQTLLQNLERKETFEAELARLQRLGANPEILTLLQGFAGQPISSLVTLREEFLGLMPSLVNIIDEPLDQSFWARMRSAFTRLIRINANTKDSETDKIEAIGGKITTALAEGDCKQAFSLWKTLPESARILSDSWSASLQQRIEIEDSLSKLWEDSLRASL